MNLPTRYPHSLSRLGLGFALASIVAGCTAQVEPGRGEVDDSLTSRQREQLAQLDISAAIPGEEGWLLFDGKGNDVGRVQTEDALVEIQLAGQLAMLGRDGVELVVGCADMDGSVTVGTPDQFQGWLQTAAVDPGCARALQVAAIVTEIDAAHAPGCELVDGPDGAQLDCEENSDYRLMAGGGTCECVDQGWGCDASCWQCTGGWNPGGNSCGGVGGEDGGGGGGGGGGGWGGGGQCSPPYPYTGFETDFSKNFAKYLAREKAKNKCYASDDGWWLCTASVHSVHDEGCTHSELGWTCEAEAICTYSY